jgi:hypothetical protein
MVTGKDIYNLGIPRSVVEQRINDLKSQRSVNVNDIISIEDEIKNNIITKVIPLNSFSAVRTSTNYAEVLHILNNYVKEVPSDEVLCLDNILSASNRLYNDIIISKDIIANIGTLSDKRREIMYSNEKYHYYKTEDNPEPIDVTTIPFLYVCRDILNYTQNITVPHRARYASNEIMKMEDNFSEIEKSGIFAYINILQEPKNISLSCRDIDNSDIVPTTLDTLVKIYNKKDEIYDRLGTVCINLKKLISDLDKQFTNDNMIKLLKDIDRLNDILRKGIIESPLGIFCSILSDPE